MNLKLTLDNLKIGQKAIITNESIDMLPLKLVEFGCMKGSEIEILHFAPFKDPIYIKMNEAHIAIRKEVARLIEVEVAIADN